MQVRDRIEELSEELTATERRLSAVLLSDYPFAALAPIQELAARCRISSPTVSRFVTKLGFPGYQSFQQHLINELKEGQRSPVDLQRTARPFPDAYLAEFMARIERLMQETAGTISEAQFARICAMLADRRAAIYIIGGRMSDVICQFLSRHLRQFRDKIYHLPADPEVWPEYLLRMRQHDVLLIMDFRRYQPALERLASTAARGGTRIVVVTDTWVSPSARYASEVLTVPIENGTLWDSYCGALAIMEAVVTRIAEASWDQTRKRIESWDDIRAGLGETRSDI